MEHIINEFLNINEIFIKSKNVGIYTVLYLTLILSQENTTATLTL